MQTAANIAQNLTNQLTPPTRPNTLNGGQVCKTEIAPPDERLCPVCWGMQFVTIVKHSPENGRYHYGETRPCPLGCAQELAQKHLRSLSGMKPEQFELSFNTRWFPSVKTAVDAILSTMDKPRGFMLLSGNYGCGKSHVLCATVNEAIGRGWTAVFTTSEQLLDHFRRAYAPETKLSYDALYEKVVNATVLCIDELDRFNTTEWAESQMFKLLNDRYQAAVSQWEPRLTVMATNRRPGELSPYLQSRLSDRISQVFDLFDAPDMRPLRRAM